MPGWTERSRKPTLFSPLIHLPPPSLPLLTSSPPHPPLSGCQPAHFTLFDLNVELNLSDPAEEQKLEHLISECEAVRLCAAEETKQIDEN